MASKQQQEVSPEDIEELLDGVDKTLDRLKTLYEQYFLGIQKQPPTFIHSEVERKLRDLTQLQIRNTGLRYRFATLQQKFGAYNSYWRRTLRQIENGTYARNLSKLGRDAARTGAAIPEEILAAMPKRMREQVLRDRDAALAIAKRRQQTQEPEAGADDDVDLSGLDGGPPDADDVVAVIKEPTELRRNLKTRDGAHVLDQGDADFDLNAFFAEVEAEDSTIGADEHPTGRRQEPIVRGSPPPSAQPVKAPITPVPPGTQPGVVPRAGSPNPRSQLVPRAATPNVVPRAPTPVPPGTQPGVVPRAASPNPNTTTPVPPGTQPGVVPRAANPNAQSQPVPRATTPVPPGTQPGVVPRAASPNPNPVPPGTQPGVRPSVPLPQRPGVPRPMVPLPARPAASQTSRPNPIAPGAAAAHNTIPVESMQGPFPREHSGPVKPTMPAIPRPTPFQGIPPIPKPGESGPVRAPSDVRQTGPAPIVAPPASRQTGPSPIVPAAPHTTSPGSTPHTVRRQTPPGGVPTSSETPSSGVPVVRHEEAGTSSRPIVTATRPTQRPPTPRPVAAQPARPAPVASRPGAAAGPPQKPPPGMTDADVNALYAKYVKAKEMVGEKIGPGEHNKLLRTINAQAPKIMQQYNAKAVDFSVVVKDNQVIIRAKPKT